MNIIAYIAEQESKIQVIIFFNEVKELTYFYTLLLKEKNKFVVNDPTATMKNKNNIAIDYVHSRCGVCLGPHRCPDDCSRSKSKRVEKLRNSEIQVLLGT
jgi:hypothetical protein